MKIHSPKSRWTCTAAAHMKVACLSLLTQEITCIIKRLTGKKYFMYFENTKILSQMYLNRKCIRFFQRYLNTKYIIVFCISNTYFKYIYQKYCPSMHNASLDVNN